MRAVDELQGPVGYDDRWLLLAGLGLALVAVYYAAVLWWGRPRREPPPPPPSGDACLARLDLIEAEVAAGRMSPRVGHQQVSATVRGFVAEASGVPARSMTLADFERHGPERVAAVVALVYAPAFGPDGAQPLTPVVAQARELVSTWT